MNEPVLLSRVGAILSASLVRVHNWGPSSFVQDEHDDYWSICTGFHESIIPVQRHSFDGWVAAVFHRECGYIKIVAPGEVLSLPKNQTVIARIHRHGVRWEFADHPT